MHLRRNVCPWFIHINTPSNYAMNKKENNYFMNISLIDYVGGCCFVVLVVVVVVVMMMIATMLIITMTMTTTTTTTTIKVCSSFLHVKSTAAGFN
jgi:hypothetical protein